ncbi:MAG: peptidoglycan editing factor PgeF [Azoarcus sp.]|jgi:YfiH family protein|nr:peptidoglycan editing factor PgeF [Azoarcus sp.]
MNERHFILPDWPAPATVRALVSTRLDGNLATRVGDDPAVVAANRARLFQHLPAEPVWLEQVHGREVIDADGWPASAGIPVADAAVAHRHGVVCAVLTADCLPVLFCDEAGSVVAAAHAGWRGLLAGVLEATLARMAVAPVRIMAWLGPAIGPQAFEVGPEVRAAFLERAPEAEAAFYARRGDKWFADLFQLARQRLAAAGVAHIHGGGLCTWHDAARFYSYRREGKTGRFASLIWLACRRDRFYRGDSTSCSSHQQLITPIKGVAM